MTEERFWLLAGLKLSGEASSEELEELESCLKEEPALRLKLATLEGSWKQPSKANYSSSRVESAFNKHMQRLSNHLSDSALQYESDEPTAPEEKKRTGAPLFRIIGWSSAIAASLLLLWYTAFNKPGESNKDSKAQSTVSTKRGSKSKIQLPDGTQVWLNADSKITYNEKFQGKMREVQLSGEAFFDVVRDEERPFIIHTNVIDVKVLGTSFNVRSYADEANTETSLIRGSVEITLRNSPDKKFTLKPNDKLIVSNDEAAREIKRPNAVKPQDKQILLTWGKINFHKSDSIATEALWIKNKLVFDKESLAEIAVKLERWYDVKVNITDERLKHVEYSGVFEDESLQQVMKALHEVGINYKINKKEVTIKP